MKLLLSINKKFFADDLKGLFDLLEEKNENKYIDGIELNIDRVSEHNISIAKRIATKLKEKNLLLQIHAPPFESGYDVHISLLKLYNELAEIMDAKISIVYHPCDANSKEKIVEETACILNKLNKNILENKYNLSLTVENLEDINNIEKLKLTELIKIIEKTNNCVGITYDIGHEVLEQKCNYNINKDIVKYIENIHIHDISIENIPHEPFYFNRTDLERTIHMLKAINYDKNIVAEIALDYLKGETYVEKLDEYLKEMIKIKQHM